MAVATQKKTPSRSRTGKSASGKTSPSGGRGNTRRSGGNRSGGSRQAEVRQRRRTEPEYEQTVIPEPRRKPVSPYRVPLGWALAVMALCVFFGMFDSSAILVGWLSSAFSGLFGYGYWLAFPSLVLASAILLLGGNRPIRARTVCALSLSPIAGVLGHLLFCYQTFTGDEITAQLWNAGKELSSGGAFSGTVARIASSLFSRPVSAIIFLVLFLAALAAALDWSAGALAEPVRRRLWYRESGRNARPAPVPPEESVPQARERQEFDFPLDGDPVPGISIVDSASYHEEPPRSEEVEPPDEPSRPARREGTPFLRRTSNGKGKTAPDTKQAPSDGKPEESPSPVPPEETDPRKLRAAASREVAAQAAAVTAEIAETMAEPERSYRFPKLTALYENKSRSYVEAGAELRGNSRRLAETLNSFGVDASAGDVIHGPSVTRYEFTLEQGVKLSKITNLADDIALALGATGVRIAPIPTKSSVVGIEVPNRQVTPVLIRDVVSSSEFRNHPSTTAFALGKDIGGKIIVGCIEQLPHVLIAGTTGSGKSVCTNSLIISMLYHSRPDQVRFIMVDPKMVELAPYNGIPHLLIPVVTDPRKAAGALQWAVVEMMKRYRIFSENGVKKLSEYNRLAFSRKDLETMPSIVVVIDELADLMMAAAKEVEESIVRMAQMGRAAGMHLVIATQRPSADVITGLMKANIPSRIAFAVASAMESRIILDTTGAEKLVGRGDMLYAPLGESRIRVQGCYIAPEEIERVVAFVKTTSEAKYDNDVIAKIEAVVQEKEPKAQQPQPEAVEETDELLPAAVDVVLETGQASVSMLQRRLKLGYSRAARLVDQMERKGYVGPFEGSRPRQLLLTKERWQEMKLNGEADAPPPPPDI